MAKILNGTLKGKGKKIAIVVARFNEFITLNLLEGCLSELAKLGVKKSSIMVAWVPGAFEIPLVAQKFAKKKDIDAVICLGAVIKGETFHFELVSEATTLGISRVSLDTEKPVIFEVLSTETLDQAYQRSELDGNNKGCDAANVAIEMINLLSKIK